MTSMKQQTANLKNSKSGGVKTEQGKAIIRNNALKHGILSKETIVVRGDLNEDAALLAQMKYQMFEELKPVGLIEIMLTDSILSTYWRWARVIKSERALIEKKLLRHQQIRNEERVKNISWQKQHPDFSECFNSSAGCKMLAYKAEMLKVTIDSSGLPLPEKDYNQLICELGWIQGISQTETLARLNFIAKDKKIMMSSKKLIEQNNKKASSIAQELANYFEERSKILENIEQKEDFVVAESDLLLNSDDLLRIQRYEAHLYRTFMHSLHELQRIQGARLGSITPPSAALDIIVNSENGFVS